MHQAVSHFSSLLPNRVGGVVVVPHSLLRQRPQGLHGGAWHGGGEAAWPSLALGSQESLFTSN